MSGAAAVFLLGAGRMFLAIWLGGMLLILFRGVPKGEEVWARTGVSLFQGVGGGGCMAVFAAVWAENLRGDALPNPWVLLWSSLLTLIGLAVLWMALVRRVWCTSSALVQRTGRGKIIIVPWEELAGAEVVFSYDDVIIPWGERQLTIDTTLPGFDQVVQIMEQQGIDLSARPPKRSSFFGKEK